MFIMQHNITFCTDLKQADYFYFNKFCCISKVETMHDPMAKTKRKRWHHNAFEHRLNAQG